MLLASVLILWAQKLKINPNFPDNLDIIVLSTTCYIDLKNIESISHHSRSEKITVTI